MILVIGSTNTDMVIGAPHLPSPGETILGSKFFMNPGGKGANQAVAAARLGGKVKFICKTGNDIFGNKSAELFSKEGIDTSSVFSDPELPSGVALITVDDNGENTIVVASGANANLNVKDLKSCGDSFDKATVVLMQLETPLDTIEYAANAAAERNVPVILNPAPAAKLPASILNKISIITPNETEASLLTGIDVRDEESAKAAARALYGYGVKTVLITLGSDGALIYHEENFTKVACRKVKAVDTTAAGDVFNGAFAVAFAEGRDIVDAARFACNAATISVTRMGAQASAPYRHELSENGNDFK